MSKYDNLNESYIPTADGPDQRVGDFGCAVTADVEVVFRDLEDRLVAEIEKSQFVVGCVAWLTNLRILKALARLRNNVLIVVQKEDFLRPDIGGSHVGWKKTLHEAYKALGASERFYWGGLIGMLSTFSDPTAQGVRCVGNYNCEKKPAFPRMHNKFLVLVPSAQESGHSPECSNCGCDTVGCYCNDELPANFFDRASVWTGSFNLTANATKSFENAVILRNRDVAAAYYKEFAQIWALSEPLNWESDWSAPEFRIGT